MEDLIWPAWVQAMAGMLGISFALSGIARAQVRGWRNRADRTSTILLLILSAALAITGLVRWVLL